MLWVTWAAIQLPDPSAREARLDFIQLNPVCLCPCEQPHGTPCTTVETSIYINSIHGMNQNVSEYAFSFLRQVCPYTALNLCAYLFRLEQWLLVLHHILYSMSAPKNMSTPNFCTLLWGKVRKGHLHKYLISLKHMPLAPWDVTITMTATAFWEKSSFVECLLMEISGACVVRHCSDLHRQWWQGTTLCKLVLQATKT